MSDRMTERELQRLAKAGVRYPWHPRQTLRILDALEGAAGALRTIARMAGDSGIGARARCELSFIYEAISERPQPFSDWDADDIALETGPWPGGKDAK